MSFNNASQLNNTQNEKYKGGIFFLPGNKGIFSYQTVSILIAVIYSGPLPDEGGVKILVLRIVWLKMYDVSYVSNLTKRKNKELN
jgi:hypothetical protein